MVLGLMKILVLAVDGIPLFHLATPLLVFREVSRQYDEEPWEARVASLDGHNAVSDEGMPMAVTGRLTDELPGADWLVIPAWPSSLPEAAPGLTQAIREAHAQGTKIIGFCLGAFPVCAAGVLDGRTATTHWACSDGLARRFPAVEVAPAPLYIDHGDVMTSAGTAAALDACLYLVRQVLGSGLAAEVAAQLVVAPHREGNQIQHRSRDLVPPEGEGVIADLLDYIDAHLHADLNVEALAQRALMSPRHLTRRFEQVTGMSPARWVKQRRLEGARRLLEETGLSVAQVAGAVGFASVVTFRQAFVAAYDTAPLSYRTRFRV